MWMRSGRRTWAVVAVAKKRPGPRVGMTEEERLQEIEEMLRLRRMGASYEAIGREFGLTARTVWGKIDTYLKDTPKHEAAQLRVIEGRKLDHYELKLQADINKGDVPAINTAIRISERRCRMMGLDMPQQHEITVSKEEEALADQLVEEFLEDFRRAAREDEEHDTESESEV